MAVSPDELRGDVRRALESSPMDSFKVSCAFLGGLATLCALLGGGLIAIQAFSRAWLVGLSVITIGGGAVSYPILELFRLNRRSQLLRELLQTEKYYESLLQAARSERDAAQATARELQTRLDVLMTIREIGRAERARPAVPEPQQQQPPEGGAENV